MPYQNHYKNMLKSTRLFKPQHQSDTYFELGYEAASVILEIGLRRGVTASIQSGEVVFNHGHMPREYRRQARDFKEHIKLFIMNEGQPPAGVTLMTPPSKPELAQRREMVANLLLNEVA